MAVPEGYVALDLVGFTDKGTYSGAAVYMKNDLVHKDNVIWRCIADNTQAVPPAAGENWEKWIEGSAQMSGCTAVDTEGMIGAENSVVVAQSLIDAIADKVMNDLVAKTQIVNNLLATVTGNVLDATQGKVLDDKITQLNGNLSGLNAETEIPLIKNDSLTVFDVKCTKVGRTVYVVAAINSSTNIPAGNGIASGFPKLKNNNVASFAVVDDSGYTYPFYIYNTQLFSRITMPGNKTIRFTVSYITEN